MGISVVADAWFGWGAYTGVIWVGRSRLLLLVHYERNTYNLNFNEFISLAAAFIVFPFLDFIGMENCQKSRFYSTLERL